MFRDCARTRDRASRPVAPCESRAWVMQTPNDGCCVWCSGDDDPTQRHPGCGSFVMAGGHHESLTEDEVWCNANHGELRSDGD